MVSHFNELASFTSFLTSFLTLSTSSDLHCNERTLAVLVIQTHVSVIKVSGNKRSFTKPKQTLRFLLNGEDFPYSTEKTRKKMEAQFFSHLRMLVLARLLFVGLAVSSNLRIGGNFPQPFRF